MTVKGDAYGTGLADAVTPRLTFNGKSAVDNEDNFARIDYPDPSTGASVDYATVIAGVIALKPHLVLLFGTTETANELFDGIEAAWGDIAPPAPRPYYLAPDGGKVAELLQKIGNDDDRRRRVRGTVPGGASALYDAFKIRYEAFINEDPLAYSETGYDAAFLLAYASLAIGDKPLTGPNLAEGLQHMSKGTGIDVGPLDINKAFDALRSAGEIDFTGASGPLDFDAATGEAKADIDIWCVGRNTSDEVVFLSSASGTTRRSARSSARTTTGVSATESARRERRSGHSTPPDRSDRCLFVGSLTILDARIFPRPTQLTVLPSRRGNCSRWARSSSSRPRSREALQRRAEPRAGRLGAHLLARGARAAASKESRAAGWAAADLPRRTPSPRPGSCGARSASRRPRSPPARAAPGP